MFVETEGSRYRSLEGVVAIGVDAVALPAAIDRPAASYWTVYVERPTQGASLNREHVGPRYSTEERANEAARALADAEDYSGVYELPDDEAVTAK